MGIGTLRRYYEEEKKADNKEEKPKKKKEVKEDVLQDRGHKAVSDRRGSGATD